MQLLKTLLILLASIALYSSCSKDDDDGPTVVGFWKGKYGGVSNYPNLPYAFLFKKDGTVRVYDGNDTTTASKADGTYTITNSTINTTYKYGGTTQYSTTAEMNPGKTFMEGTYGSGANTSGNGRFFVVKQ